VEGLIDWRHARCRRTFRRRAASKAAICSLQVLLCLAGAELAWGECLGEESRDDMDTSVWAGEPTVVLRSLAECVAPVLWFSPDDTDAPTSLAGVGLYRAFNQVTDAPGGTLRRKLVVVYFQLQRLTGGRLVVGADSTTLHLEDNGTLILRYFLYFSRDATHLHDLEHVDVHLRSVRGKIYGSNTWTWRLWPERIVGQAHGNVWYSNTLKLSRQTSVKRMSWL
jgi:hypothetical protein